MPTEPIRVLIADDHTIVRSGILALLETIDGTDVIAEAADGQEAVDKSAQLRPDVILMDLEMPVMDGVAAIETILARQDDVRVLVLSSFAGDDRVFPAMKAGALGYLLKDSDPDELVEAIRQVHRGESWLHPKIARKLIQEISSPSPQQRPRTDSPLTPREMEVLIHIAQGLDNPDIAARLNVSETTVRGHVGNILGKLQLANRAQAVLYALREGYASLEDGA
ncbi:MAG: response regulator transcription factor [Caldilineaceae bacterium]